MAKTVYTVSREYALVNGTRVVVELAHYDLLKDAQEALVATGEAMEKVGIDTVRKVAGIFGIVGTQDHIRESKIIGAPDLVLVKGSVGGVIKSP